MKRSASPRVDRGIVEMAGMPEVQVAFGRAQKDSRAQRTALLSPERDVREAGPWAVRGRHPRDSRS